MTPFNYAEDSGVFINRCAGCHGVWLESGQLELIAQYCRGTPAMNALVNPLADEARRARKWQVLRETLRSRLLSGVVALTYLLVALLSTGKLEAVFGMTRFLLLPMFCIWFPDAMGRRKGVSIGLGCPVITETTPGDCIAFGGWLLLALPAVVMWIARG